MVRCSRHDIPPAVEGDLTNRQGHGLSLELRAREINQRSPISGSVDSLTFARGEVVDPH
jgi:hypothetical protein